MAIDRGVRVGEVAACGVDVVLHVIEAGLAGGRVEADELDGGADDFVVGETGGEHAVDEVGEGGDAVHEDPEAWEGARSGQDAGRVISILASGVGMLGIHTRRRLGLVRRGVERYCQRFRQSRYRRRPYR